MLNRFTPTHVIIDHHLKMSYDVANIAVGKTGDSLEADYVWRTDGQPGRGLWLGLSTGRLTLVKL